MSTERNFRPGNPATGRRFRPPRSSPSAHRRRPTPPMSKSLQHNDILPKSRSEPLLQFDDVVAGEDRQSFESDGLLYRPRTCADVFSFPPNLLDSPNSHHLEGYQKDAKVVVNVTVEGSPGPIRTLVKLGSSVEDTIKHVIRRYDEEGRSPRLHKNAASCFDLHLSYFSLESLDRSDAIGDVGSRNFYLRKNSGSKAAGAADKLDAASTPLTSEIVHVKESYPQPFPLLAFLPAHITQKFTKFVRKMCKFWKILGCIH
ncbi:hypothetical protein Ancab_014905 [Ancistrocladus abbreviatus]